MRTFTLDVGCSARERGRRYGESFAREIREIASIRSELCQSQAMFRSDAELLAVAELHLPVLRAFDVDLHDELVGIAEGAGVPASRVVVLNHYTDLKDLDPGALLGGAARGRQVDKEEDCSAIVWATDSGPVLAQTWDMHGSAAPYVLMLEVPAHTKSTGEHVASRWLLSITGCLGMAGMSALGVGVTINNLKSGDGRVGIVWPALVRRALEATDARAARDVILGAPLGSGHHYLVADRDRAFGIETSGTLFEVWAEADLTRVGTGFHHENHCRGVEVAKVSSISPVSTTLLRHAAIEGALGASRPRSLAEVWAILGSHDGHPRGVCTHLASAASPHAVETCAGLAMDLRDARLYAHPGCIHASTPREFTFAR